ncbi:MAG TPA: caspase family protein, partial [Chitinophagaceae bacterium]|nr:caspase family protein [Chitinophagaceae bacterium]
KLESADVLEFKFIYDAETDLFVPDYALFRTKIDDDNYEDDEMKFTDAILLDEKDLTAELIKKFFKPDEEIYQNYVTEETASVRPLTPQEKQTKLMLLVVANTEDEEIGATCVKDKDRMLKTFGDLAEFLQIQFVPKTIFGADYNKKNVDDAINALKPSPNDIVVFYYTGHGFGYIQNNNELFPYIALTAKSFEDPVKNSLNMENVFERIKSKGARMNLVLSDCCNSDINGRNTIVGDFASTRPSQLPWDTANCRKLFLESKISILGTAAKKGEYSAGTGSLGGIFTYNFRTAMVTFLSKFNNYKPSWPQILKSAEMSTAEKADRTTCNNPNGTSDKCNQHPVFVIK